MKRQKIFAIITILDNGNKKKIMVNRKRSSRNEKLSIVNNNNSQIVSVTNLKAVHTKCEVRIQTSLNLKYM